MGRSGKFGRILVGREEIALAGGIKAALDEAHSFVSMKMTPRTIARRMRRWEACLRSRMARG
jgi:hypothetical protein